MRVTACVVSWNSAAQLVGVLDSLLEQIHAELEVVVVDNASGDGSQALVRRYPGVRLVENARNCGFAAAANQGITLARKAGSGAFLACNPDVVLDPTYLTAALAVLEAGPRRGAVQGRLWRYRPADGVDPRAAAAVPRLIDTTGHVAFVTRLFRNRGEGQPDSGQYQDSEEIFGVSGAVALYRMEALDDVACRGEVFDEDLFAYWEDIDLDWRLQRRGWQAWYAPEAHGWHERGGAGPRRSAVVERLNFANRFLVLLKNDDARAFARHLPGIALTTALKAGELALTVPQAFVGSFAALRLVPRMLAKRRLVTAAATVDAAAVVARWFEPFDYAAWVGAWWRRVRSPH